MGLPITSRRQNKKFFDPAIFQKCWRGVGEQPTFAEQIKLAQSMQQKSKSKSKESQLPSNKKGCSKIQGFRGNCDSQGKLGMCPSLAESDSGGIPRRELLLEKTVFPVRQKGVPPLLLPTSVLQLPRCLARTYNLDFHDATLFELNSFKRCNCSRKSNSQKSNLLRKCGLLAHTSPTFLKNCWIKKLFNCLRLGASITIPIKKQESL